MQLHVNTESNGTKKKSDNKNKSKRKVSSLIHRKSKVVENTALENTDVGVNQNQDDICDDADKEDNTNILDFDNISGLENANVNIEEIRINIEDSSSKTNDINSENVLSENSSDNIISNDEEEICIENNIDDDDDIVEDVIENNEEHKESKDKHKTKLKNKRISKGISKENKSEKTKPEDTNTKSISLIDALIYLVAGVCLFILGTMVSDLLVNIMVNSVIGG